MCIRLRVPHLHMQFMAYEELKSFWGGGHPASLNSGQYLLLGASSKVVASVTTYPFQVIRTRLQMQQSASAAHVCVPLSLPELKKCNVFVQIRWGCRHHCSGAAARRRGGVLQGPCTQPHPGGALLRHHAGCVRVVVQCIQCQNMTLPRVVQSSVKSNCTNASCNFIMARTSETSDVASSWNKVKYGGGWPRHVVDVVP